MECAADSEMRRRGLPLGTVGGRIGGGGRHGGQVSQRRHRFRPAERGCWYRHNMPTRIEAAFGASQLLMHSITRLMLDKHKPDLLIRPEISDFRVLDFLYTEKILKRTEATRAEVRKGLERLLSA